MIPMPLPPLSAQNRVIVTSATIAAVAASRRTITNSGRDRLGFLSIQPPQLHSPVLTSPIATRRS